jgi:hypothetical protein
MAGKIILVHHIGATGGLQPGSCLLKAKLKNTDFITTMITKVLRDLRFSLNQPLKSADD